MTNVSVIGSVGVPANYGGFESLVENLLDHAGDELAYTVVCSGKRYARRLASYKGARLVYVSLDANGPSSVPYDLVSMFRSLRSDVLLVLGVSGCLFLPLFRLFYRGRVVTNIDGMEWKRAKWRGPARLFLRLSERSAVLHSDVVVADNAALVDYVRRAYGRDARLIEYGGDRAGRAEDADYGRDYPFTASAYALAVCRIEPENNVAAILSAFGGLEGRPPLVFVGNWGDSGYGRRLRAEYGGRRGIVLLDAIYDPGRLDFIRSRAAAYVHGHSVGGTNPSLVEAMNLGLPVLAFDCVYNRNTTEGRAAYWSCPAGLRTLAEGVGALAPMGPVMKSIAERRYTWRIVAEKYRGAFLA